MAFINFGKKTINFKIVYYGPARGGKTTNLEKIHEGIQTESRGELTILSTQQDRTLFFDFLPLESTIITGFTTKFQLYTVPGQIIYNQTRKLVLQGVDAVVFVSDSQWQKMEENVESFENLESNLKDQDMSLNSLPFMLQFNKRDLSDTAPVHYMDFLLNRRETRVPTIEATAVEGVGVFESLNLISRMTLAAFIRKHNLKSSVIPNNVCVSSAENTQRRPESCSTV
jgi:signal recognition particle receptor subunit beta